MYRAGLYSGGDVRVEGNTRSIKIGLEQLGYKVSQLNPAIISEGDLSTLDLVVFNGFRKEVPHAARKCEERGVPCFIYDLGYIKRAGRDNPRDYHQLGLYKICWVPERPMPSDRWNALGVEVKPKRQKSKDYGDFVLVVAQKPGDGQHHLDEGGIKKWVHNTIETLKKHTNKEIRFRPHPKDRHPISIEGVVTEDAGTLTQVSKRAHCIVTYNSTSGIECLLEGVPVICDPNAHYSDLCETNLENVDNPYVASKKEKLDYFHRLAYAQWNVDELETGKPFRFLLDYLEGKDFGGSVGEIEEPEESEARDDDQETSPEEKEEDDWRNLPWFSAKKHVKEVTGVTPKNKKEAEELMVAFDELNQGW